MNPTPHTTIVCTVCARYYISSIQTHNTYIELVGIKVLLSAQTVMGNVQYLTAHDSLGFQERPRVLD